MNKIIHANYLRISSNRTYKVLPTLKQLNDFVNNSFYKFLEKRIKGLFDLTDLQVDEIRKKLSIINNKEIIL